MIGISALAKETKTLTQDTKVGRGWSWADSVISYMHRVRYHQSSGCDYTDTVSVMLDTVVVLSFIHHVRYHIY